MNYFINKLTKIIVAHSKLLLLYYKQNFFSFSSDLLTPIFSMLLETKLILCGLINKPPAHMLKSRDSNDLMDQDLENKRWNFFFFLAGGIWSDNGWACPYFE